MSVQVLQPVLIMTVILNCAGASASNAPKSRAANAEYADQYQLSLSCLTHALLFLGADTLVALCIGICICTCSVLAAPQLVALVV